MSEQGKDLILTSSAETETHVSLETGAADIRAAANNAKPVSFPGTWAIEDAKAQLAAPEDEAGSGQKDPDLPETIAPIVPLGHSAGKYYFIAPSGELRIMAAEALEAGRGVRALFGGFGDGVENWCRSTFGCSGEKWDHKKAGLWITEQCNGKGVFDLANSDLRSIGVWRDETGIAVSHCGNRIVYSDGKCGKLQEHVAHHVMVASGAIAQPDFRSLQFDKMKNLLSSVERLWGWKRDEDAAIWLGWVAAASLGGFPDWRTHLYIHGSRGSGKSKLIETTSLILGDLAGEVINDATEAGIRQSRNNHARPLLIDEFEPNDNPRKTSAQSDMLALFRRMSGGAGGRISRGSADHSPKTFRTLGAVYVTSINHIQLEPQDRSRFIILELGPIPSPDDPRKAALLLERVVKECKKISGQFRGKMIAESWRWDRTHASISALARTMGADPRQADTAATVLAGLDLALFEGDLDDMRLEDLRPLVSVLLEDAQEASEASEGKDALDYLVTTLLTLDHGIKRTVRELISATLDEKGDAEVQNPGAALRRHGIYIDVDNRVISLRTCKSSPTAAIYAGTKWVGGAHSSAIQKLEGVLHSGNPRRVWPGHQYRVLVIPFSALESG